MGVDPSGELTLIEIQFVTLIGAGVGLLGGLVFDAFKQITSHLGCAGSLEDFRLDWLQFIESGIVGGFLGAAGAYVTGNLLSFLAADAFSGVLVSTVSGTFSAKMALGWAFSYGLHPVILSSAAAVGTIAGDVEAIIKTFNDNCLNEMGIED